MDLAVAIVLGAVVLDTIVVAVLLFVRWRRNRYQFSIRAVLISFTIVACALIALKRYVAPIIAHRMAVQEIYTSGGGLLFRDDYDPNSGTIYSDLSKSNPWRDVAIIHATTDAEALAVADQLKYVPEVESLFLIRVTDTGLAALCDVEPAPLVDTINLCESPVTPTGLAHLAKARQLETLFFNSCPLDDSCLACLKSIESIRHLTLLEEGKTANPNRFTEAGFHSLGELQQLDSLWLVQQTISNAAAGHLKNLARLKKLQLSRCQISDNAISELRAALPDCEIKIYPPEPATPAPSATRNQ